MRARKTSRPRLSGAFLSALICAATYLLFLGMLFAVYRPAQYDLRADQPSPITITASRDVEDSYTTQQLIDEAVAAVPISYMLDETVQPAVLEDLNAFFDAVDAVRSEDQTEATNAHGLLMERGLNSGDIQALAALDDDTAGAIREDTVAIIDELLQAESGEPVVKDTDKAEEIKEEDSEVVSSDLIRPEMKEAIDAYEDFVDEYIAFMEKYGDSDGNDLSLLLDYTNFMSKLTDYTDKMEKMEDDMTDAEMVYYLEVMNRCNEKIIKAAY